MQYFGFMNKIIKIQEKEKKSCTQTAVNMEKLKYHPLKTHHYFFPDCFLIEKTLYLSIFYKKIRQYNSLFAFTSMGGNIDKNINKGEGPYVFRINGQIHHRIGSLLPKPDNIPKFTELYIFDTKNEIENRIRALTTEDPEDNDINPFIVQGLKEMLDHHNPLVKTFRRARDLLEEHKGIDISIRIIGANKGDQI